MATISFLITFTVLFFLPWATKQDTFENITTFGHRVNLTCPINSTAAVTWWIYFGSHFTKIFNCNENGPCDETKEGKGLPLFDFQANRHNDASILSLLPGVDDTKFQCQFGTLNRIYNVISIDPSDIKPYCNLTLPSLSTGGDPQMIISCGFTFTQALSVDAVLTIKGIGNEFSEVVQPFEKNKSRTLQLDDFDDIYNASCTLYYPSINITRSCIYPDVIKSQYIAEGSDVIVKCGDVSDADWSLFDTDGREEDIEDRTWTSEGGRSLLITDTTQEDVGKVVVCQTKGDVNNNNNGTVGFTIISKIPGDNNKSNSEDPAPTPSALNPYLVLTLLFLSLWLITTAVFGVLLWCKTQRNKSSFSVTASASGSASVPNWGSGERETPLVNVGTGARGDPNTLNTNNSAHNPVFEPEVNSADENNQNHQSSNESHLYFTLEKSSLTPVNSLPRASIANWKHPDAEPVSPNQPQSSHWQGYETVDEPNKGATSSYDLGEYAEVGKHSQEKGPPDFGEYAEVGKHFQGKGPPDLGEYAEVGKHFQGKWPPDLSGRPSIRKKPGRENVMGDDISRLYSKVNK